MPSRFRVVIADDAPDMRMLVTFALEGSGHFEVVGQAANGREAVDVAAATQPDLTVLDLSMPVMDGLEALPLIRERAPATVVVVMSGLDESVYADQARASGAAGFVAKGTAPQHLVDRLLEVLDPSARSVAREATRSFPADDRSPAAARAFVQKMLRSWSCGDELVEAALLLTSELVSNAVVHAHAAPAVTVRINDGQVRIAVSDDGSGALQLRTIGEFDVSGRGLHIVESLATSWGTTSDGNEKVVWFEL